MSTSNISFRASLLSRFGALTTFAGVASAHLLAFAAVIFQLGWIIPVYKDAFETTRRALPAMTVRSLELNAYFVIPSFQCAFLGLLLIDFLVLFLLFRRRARSNYAFHLYSHAVLVGAIGFLFWNSIALCIGLPRID